MAQIIPSRPSNPNRFGIRTNYRLTDEDRLGAGPLRQKCRDNLAAIELLRQLRFR
jgi:hypothetical protein